MTFDDQSAEAANKKTRRQASLLREIEERNFVSVDEITRRYSVTTQTARRDIMALEEAGRVRRLHGGAALAVPLDPGTYRQRRTDRAVEKTRIAATVARLIPDGATVFLDTGTTCEAVARALLAKRGLRIVTYSLRVASLISEHSEFTLAIPGGFVRPIDGGVSGEDTTDFIRRFKFDYAVVSVSGIDDEGDLCDDDHTEVAIVSTAMKQATQVILAVDNSKFNKTALVRLGSMRDVHSLVTDRAPPASLNARLLDFGVTLHLPQTARA
ncbi:DeoR/GlpR transcriptional regulator [Tianweitania sp. BSSL-BM11]|uniref:DeoR/GlpR transcriptional regulator n=1 Tax=Tianweitania aestuarii TaxID=2814886 RepID=A0ABS5RQI6_9HYPH|nr:DeoR/GlpR family DNA-binding transcription regulator [Tianweitania aestuarii]MBS9719305.1 DeoR/GlpR transcriptional regulator [Tianweitania aestuarii]